MIAPAPIQRHKPTLLVAACYLHMRLATMLHGCSRPALNAAQTVLPAGHGVPAFVSTGLAESLQELHGIGTPWQQHLAKLKQSEGPLAVQSSSCSLRSPMAASQQLICYLAATLQHPHEHMPAQLLPACLLPVISLLSPGA